MTPGGTPDGLTYGVGPGTVAWTFACRLLNNVTYLYPRFDMSRKSCSANFLKVPCLHLTTLCLRTPVHVCRSNNLDHPCSLSVRPLVDCPSLGSPVVVVEGR